MDMSLDDQRAEEDFDLAVIGMQIDFEKIA